MDGCDVDDDDEGLFTLSLIILCKFHLIMENSIIFNVRVFVYV